jgi:WD40 repeat protein
MKTHLGLHGGIGPVLLLVGLTHLVGAIGVDAQEFKDGKVRLPAPGYLVECGEMVDDGRYAAVVFGEALEFAARKQQYVVLFALDTKDKTRKIFMEQTGSKFGCLAWLPSLGLIVTGGANADDVGLVKVWDFRTGKLGRSLNGHKDRVVSIARTRDDRFFATADLAGKLIIWDARSLVAKLSLECKGDISGLAIGSQSIIVGYDGVKMIDLKDTTKRRVIVEEGEDRYKYTRFSPNEKLLATGTYGILQGSQLQIWQSEDGKLLADFGELKGWMSCLVWSRDGSKLVTGLNRPTKWESVVYVWDAASRKQVAQYELKNQYVQSVLASSGRSVLALVSDRTDLEIITLGLRPKKEREKGSGR